MFPPFLPSLGGKPTHTPMIVPDMTTNAITAPRAPRSSLETTRPSRTGILRRPLRGLRPWRCPPQVPPSLTSENAAHILEYGWQFLRVLVRGGACATPVVDRKIKVIFPDGGELRCFAANPDTARGFPADLIIFDEFGHFRGEVDLDREMLKAVTPSRATRGAARQIILSTPGGPVGAFADLWRGWPEDQKITIHYTQCPTLVANIREEILPFGRQYWIGDTAFPQDAFLQEFCNVFDPGYGQAIPWDALNAAVKEGVQAWE